MLYPSREHSTIRVSKYNEAEFRMVWCTPGSFIIPSDFDLLLSISNEITTVLEYQEEKNESLGKKSSLSDFIMLTKRRFAISLNLEVFNKFVSEDLIETDMSKDCDLLHQNLEHFLSLIISCHLNFCLLKSFSE